MLCDPAETPLAFHLPFTGSTLLGRTGKEQVAAGFSVYGPRTVLVLARPDGERAPPVTDIAHAPSSASPLMRQLVVGGD